MQIIRAAGERLALEPFLAHVGHAVAVRVGEFPNAGRRGDVERTIEPQATLRQHHLVREGDRLVEASIAIRVFEPHDAMRFLRELLFHFVIRAGGVGDVEAAQFIEVRFDRARDEIGASHEFNFESIWQREIVRADFELCGVSGTANGEQKNANETTHGLDDSNAITPARQVI